MTNKKPVKKPFAQRIFELSQSLKIIYDCLSLLKKGQTHQIIPLSGQLRALLTDKTTQPLLFVIGEDLKEKLSFYVMEKADIPTDGLLFVKSNFHFALEQELPGQKLVVISDFLDDDVIMLGKNSCSMRDIISWYAHKAGGAHYSPDMPEDMVDLLASGFGEVALIDALFAFGEAIYRLGQRLFKKVVNADIHLLLQIPQGVENEAFVMDFKDAQSPMRLSLKAYPRLN